MNEKMKVLIAYDGSSYADAAIDNLRRAGLPQNGEALIISVADVSNAPIAIPVELGVYGKFVSKRMLEETINMTQTETARARNEAIRLAVSGGERFLSILPGWRVKNQVALGKPAEELLKKAGEFKPDLIVVGTHGRSAVGRFFLGSVSQKVLTEANASVRVAHSLMPDNEDEPTRIIIGVDGSSAAEEAIYAVGQRVWQAGTEVRLVAVDDASSPKRIAPRLPQAAGMINSYFQSRGDRVREMLDWATEELTHIGLKTTVLMEKGDPKSVLLEESRKWNADSIFVGTRDFKNGFERFRMGSVSSAIAANADCPVEIVRPAENLRN